MAEKKKAEKKETKKAVKKPAVKATAAKATEKKPVAKKADAKKSTKTKAKATTSGKKKAVKVVKDKGDIIADFATHGKDTGSAQVQVAILTNRINSLQSHLKDHPKDSHSRKGLLGMVGKRRKHLDYLRTKKEGDYDKLIKELGLRK
ncbi:30S ribosomal protein S15 [Candidatus Peregrinibacteria bacterium]|jgi:small subunit ribosomal protein S15|nr:30S ribosomal protein S15 [Candidatus Peregrinibacteria bacterium]